MRLSTPKPTRQHLRALARDYLTTNRKLQITPVRSAGRSEDTYFRCLDEDGREFEVAIRTAKNGRAAFRRKHDRWNTVEDADYILIAAFGSKEKPKFADLYFIESKSVLRALNQAYSALNSTKKKAKSRFPVWISLEEVKSGPKSAGSGVVEEAIDHVSIPLNSAFLRKDTVVELESATEFPMVELVLLREAVARQLRIPTSAVDISIQIRMQ